MKNLFRNDDYLWVNKYQPNTLNDCVMPKRIKSTLNHMVESGEVMSLLLDGGAGVGKTSAALCLANDLNADVLFINASLEGNMDMLRTKIRDFASSVSMTSDAKKKVIILDECEGVSAPVQPALRGMLEEFSRNAIFILTTNYARKLIQPIHSRCNVIKFAYTKEETMEVQSIFFKRILNILDKESVAYDKKVVAQLVGTHFPDFRGLLNLLQRYSSGTINASIFADKSGASKFSELVPALKGKKFGVMRQWIAESTDISDNAIYTEIYDTMDKWLTPASVPAAVIIIGDYQYKAAFVANPQINLCACLTTMMSECEFKD
ncbi:MAG: AAA family ATPase [Ghiorsea sp.]